MQSAVIDHQNFDVTLDGAAEGDHTLIAAQNFIKNAAPILGAKGISAPVLFRGVGQAATNSPLVFKGRHSNSRNPSPRAICAVVNK